MRQIKQDIEILLEEHLQSQAYAARLAETTENDLTTKQVHKERSIALKEMKNREKQARAWKKISYATKTSSTIGVTKLGIPRGF